MLNHFNRDRSSKQSHRSKSTDAQVSRDNEDFLFIAILVFFFFSFSNPPTMFPASFPRVYPNCGHDLYLFGWMLGEGGFVIGGYSENARIGGK